MSGPVSIATDMLFFDFSLFFQRSSFFCCVYFSGRRFSDSQHYDDGITDCRTIPTPPTFLRAYIRLGGSLQASAINLEKILGTEHIMVIMDEQEWKGQGIGTECEGGADDVRREELLR